MNDICRLCLSVFNQKGYKLSEECDILRKIKSCLKVQIHLNRSLPKYVCKKCFKKIEEIYEFRKMIAYNQEQLQQYFSCGVSILKDFYSKLKNNIEIKDESVILGNKNDNFVKLEVPNYFDNCNDIQIKKDNEFHDCNVIGNNTDSGSEDSISLSSLKKKQTIVQDSTANMEIENTEVESCQLTKKHVPNSNLLKNAILLNPFTCLSCSEQLESQIELIKHYHKFHKSYNGELTDPKYIVNEAEGKKIYNCKLCNETCKKKQDILKHINIHQKPFICKICGRTYRTVAEIVRHSRAHNGIKLLCSYHCGFTTAYKGALKDHENRHLETPDYKYKCLECGKGFFVRTWYEQHLNIHSGLKPFVCELCGMAFHIQRYLTAHKSTVHQQASNINRYVCVHCLHPCDTAKSLAEHLKEHGIKNEFLCDECGKIFKSADKLRNHQYTHSQLKPFTCSICSKSFAKKFSLKMHEIAHTGDRLHACAHCDKKYVQKATLHRHCRRHHATARQ